MAASAADKQLVDYFVVEVAYLDVVMPLPLVENWVLNKIHT